MGLLWLRQDEILGMTDELEIFELLKSPSVALFSGNDHDANSSATGSSSGGSVSGNGEEGNQTGQLRFATAFTADALFSAAYKMKTDVPLPRASRRIFPVGSHHGRRATTMNLRGQSSFSSSNGGSNSSLDQGSSSSSGQNSHHSDYNGARRRSFMMPSMSPFRHSSRRSGLMQHCASAAGPPGGPSAPWDNRASTSEDRRDIHRRQHHSYNNGSGDNSTGHSPRLHGIVGFGQPAGVGGTMSFDSSLMHLHGGPRSPLSDGSVGSHDDGHQDFGSGGGGGALRSPLGRLGGGGGANRPLPTIFSQTLSGDETFDSSNLSRASSSHGSSSSGGHHSGNSPLSSSLEGLADLPESPHENMEEVGQDDSDEQDGEAAAAGADEGEDEELDRGVSAFPMLHPITEGAEARAYREDTSAADSGTKSVGNGPLTDSNASASNSRGSSKSKSMVASPAMHVRSASHENLLLLLSEEDRNAHDPQQPHRQSVQPLSMPPPTGAATGAAAAATGAPEGSAGDGGPESPGATGRTRILCTRTSSLSSFASDTRPTTSQSFDASAAPSTFSSSSSFGAPIPPPSPSRGWSSRSSSSVGRSSSSSPMRPFGSHHQPPPPHLHLQHSHNSSSSGTSNSTFASDAGSGSGSDSKSSSNASSFASFSFNNTTTAATNTGASGAAGASSTPGSGGSGNSIADWGQSTFRARLGNNSSGGSLHSLGGGGGGDHSSSRGPSFITGGGGSSRAGSASRPSSLDRHSNLSPGGSADYSEGTGGSRARGSGGWGLSSDRVASSSSSVARGQGNEDLGESNEAHMQHGGVPPWQSCMGHFPNKQVRLRKEGRKEGRKKERSETSGDMHGKGVFLRPILLCFPISISMHGLLFTDGITIMHC